MEKDLRDAYKALTLIRADLVQTKKEKKALEAQLASLTAQQQQCLEVDERLVSMQETFRMREEDFHMQWQEMVRSYEHKHRIVMQKNEMLVQEVELLRAAEIDKGNNAKKEPQQKRIFPQGYDGEEPVDNQEEHIQNENEFELVMNKTQHTSSIDEDESPDDGDSQQHGALVMVHKLRAELARQTTEMNQTHAVYAAQKEKLRQQVSEMTLQLTELQTNVAELQHAKQGVEEKYDFLVTELEMVKQECDDLQTINTSLKEKSAHLQQKLEEQELEMVALYSRYSREKEQRNTHTNHIESKMETYNQTNLLLQQELKEKEELLKKLTEEILCGAMDKEVTIREQHRLETALLEREAELKQAAIALAKYQEKQQQMIDATNVLERLVNDMKSERHLLQKECDENISSLIQVNSTLQEQLAEKETEHNEFAQKLLEREHEWKQQLQSCESKYKSTIEDLENNLQELTASLVTIKQQRLEDAQLFEAQSAALRNDIQTGDNALQDLCVRMNKDKEEWIAREKDLLHKISNFVSDISARKGELQELEQTLINTKESNRRLEAELNEKIKVIAQLEDEKVKCSSKLTDIETMHHERIIEQQRQHNEIIKHSASALLEQLQELTEIIRKAEQEAITYGNEAEALQFRIRSLEAEQSAVIERAEAKEALLSYRLNTLEIQLMKSEDEPVQSTPESEYDAILNESAFAIDSTSTWLFIKQKIQDLGPFRRHLQSFAAYLDDALCLCDSNSSALQVLPSPHAGESFLRDIFSFLQRGAQLRDIVTSTSHWNQVRRFRDNILHTLSQWYECVTETEGIPSPAFTIASREAALILHNWTRDKTKRLATKQWLTRMETLTVYDSQYGKENGNTRGLVLPLEGSTLEMQHMTLEVKEAFLMLIVPILKRNPAIYVRVFTRKAMTGGRNTTSTNERIDAGNEDEDGEDKSWEMKIHVQMADTGTRAVTPLRVPAEPTIERHQAYPRQKPPPLQLAQNHHEPPVSATASVPTNVQLQLIQERLQRMQTK